MKRTTKTILIITALTLLLAAGMTQAAPRLTLPEVAFDFGFVPQHATISHKFWLISSGEDTLKILKIVPG